ncbi:hypothetical protein BGX24_002185 [Mortierella sp. AD032]|nr:hypothetical protein BGX24_002185 [Mortierella sp. AD032]
MSSIHPLELPEIIARVSIFLPLWVKESVPWRTRTVFKPKTFVNCMPVSKLWREPLLPILWADYDSEDMAIVPESIIEIYCPYFRTLLAQRSQVNSTVFQCTRLVHLTLNPHPSNLNDHRRLINSNSSLRSLEWNGPDIDLLHLALEDSDQLLQLESLTLSDWIETGGSLRKVHLPLARSLKKLKMKHTKVADVYLALTQLSLSGISPALRDSKLNLDKYMDNYVSDKDVARISESLRDHCPKLVAFVLQGTIDERLKATLIGNIAASNSLLELVVVVFRVERYLVDSIARHALTLETLGILLTTNNHTNLDLLFQLPMRCPQLKYLSILASFASEPGQDIVDALKTSTWGCRELEVLDVHIGEPYEKA